MTDAMWLILVIGIFLGWWIGRSMAERGRARYDMNRIWKARQNYRDDD